jgi:hypothetical protein
MWRISWVINKAKGLIAIRIFATLKQIFCKEDAWWQFEQRWEASNQVTKNIVARILLLQQHEKKNLNKIQDKMKNNYEFFLKKIIVERIFCS